MADNPSDLDEPDGFIFAQVRRTNRNLLLWNVPALVALLAVAWVTRVYYYNFFCGPFPADDSTLLAAAREPGNGGLLAYVELRDRNLVPSGFTEVSTRDDKPYSSIPLFMTAVGDRMMLVQTRTQDDGRRLVGPLYRVPADVEHKVIGSIVEKHPEMRDRFLPVMLNASAAFTVIGYIGLAVGVPLALLCLFNVGKALLRTVEPRRHPMAKDADTAAEIDREVAAGPVDRFGPVTVTRSWLLQAKTFGLRAVWLEDAVWVWHRSAGGRHVAVIRVRDGKTVYVGLLKRQLVPKVLRAVTDRVPWVLAGFDKRLDEQWRKRPADVIALADKRRQQQGPRGFNRPRP